MQLLNYNLEPFCVGHWQGNSRNVYTDTIKQLLGMPVALPPNVQIVTTANKQDMLLLNQLRLNGINFINCAEQTKEWLNTFKLQYILEGLYYVDSEYALVLDAADVLLTNDVINIVDKFRSFNKPIIFNATIANYPRLMIDFVPKREERGKFKYLNAGCCFGKKKDLIEFYKETIREFEKPFVGNYKHSEQRVIRQVFAKQLNNVDFDSECKLFQTFAETKMFLTDIDKYQII